MSSAAPGSVAHRVDKIIDECSGVYGQCGISSADIAFMQSLKERAVVRLSDKQEKWLADIERRAFEEE